MDIEYGPLTFNIEYNSGFLELTIYKTEDTQLTLSDSGKLLDVYVTDETRKKDIEYSVYPQYELTSYSKMYGVGEKVAVINVDTSTELKEPWHITLCGRSSKSLPDETKEIAYSDVINRL